jgi:ribosome biogenesis GTPase
VKIEVNDLKIKGRVCEVQRELYKVICQYGEVKAKLKGTFLKEKDNLDIPVVGDYVLLYYNKEGDSRIESVLERKSAFSRTDFSGHVAKYVKTVKKQVLVANFDYVFILSSLNNDFSINRIARYISTTLQSGAKPVVILTKADICASIDSYIAQVREVSTSAEVIAISAVTGYGMEQLEKYIISGITIALLGSSGVGKSTLVNAMAGEHIMEVSQIREVDSKGRHTTTHRQLITLPTGVTIIDTPGIRELGMWDAKEGIDDTFSDITELFTKCRFQNCNHNDEPGCAVNQALEEETLSKERWKTYCQLVRENEWGKRKANGPKKQNLTSKVKRG